MAVLWVLLSKVIQNLGFSHSTMCMLTMQFMSAFAMPSKSETQMLDYVNSFSEIIKTYQFVGGKRICICKWLKCDPFLWLIWLLHYEYAIYFYCNNPWRPYIYWFLITIWSNLHGCTVKFIAVCRGSRILNV